MALEQKQLQKQTLSMTSQMRQAIKILELSNLDLQQFLSQQIEQNPFLSIEETHSEQQVSLEEPKSDFEREDYANVWTSQECSSNNRRSDSSAQGFDIENIVDRPQTLRDHLIFQLNTDIHDPHQKLIAHAMIDDIEVTGYLKSEAEHLIKALGCSKQLFDSTLQLVQKFDPPGVFARNLAECIRLQLDDKDLLSPELELVLSNLSLLEKGNIQQLLKKCHMTPQALDQCLKLIKTLNPKPGLEFDHADVTSILPDVIVFYDKQSAEWCVKLNERTLPRLLIDQTYESRIQNHPLQKDTLKFLTTALNDANWLVKTLTQRANNILKIATEIVRLQKDFFNYGIHHLKPLVLREIAQETGVHESTVSRITNNKYLVSPRGTFELKYFFSSTVKGTEQGEQLSSSSVKRRIHELIQSEPKETPHSDDKLVELLKNVGINTARRTVAKYRESLGIPSSYERKRRTAIKDLAS